MMMLMMLVVNVKMLVEKRFVKMTMRMMLAKQDGYASDHERGTAECLLGG